MSSSFRGKKPVLGRFAQVREAPDRRRHLGGKPGEGGVINYSFFLGKWVLFQFYFYSRMPVVSVCPGFKGNWDFNDFSGLYQVFEERNGGFSILNLANLFFYSRFIGPSSMFSRSHRRRRTRMVAQPGTDPQFHFITRTDSVRRPAARKWIQREKKQRKKGKIEHKCVKREKKGLNYI